LALRRVATIESIGSSTRIEGSKLSDRDVEKLLANLKIKSFTTRDEQEAASYAVDTGKNKLRMGVDTNRLQSAYTRQHKRKKGLSHNDLTP
jgi:Fic family protein